MTEVTRILDAIGQGDPQAAAQLLPLVYDELRQLAAKRMAREQPGQTLQATALVHEAYLRLVASDGRETSQAQQWDSRGHFFAAAAEAMRRILIEQARRRAPNLHGTGPPQPAPPPRGRAPEGGTPGRRDPRPGRQGAGPAPGRSADEAGRPPAPGGPPGAAPLFRRPDRGRGRAPARR